MKDGEHRMCIYFFIKCIFKIESYMKMMGAQNSEAFLKLQEVRIQRQSLQMKHHYNETPGVDNINKIMSPLGTISSSLHLFP